MLFVIVLSFALFNVSNCIKSSDCDSPDLFLDFLKRIVDRKLNINSILECTCKSGHLCERSLNACGLSLTPKKGLLSSVLSLLDPIVDLLNFVWKLISNPSTVSKYCCVVKNDIKNNPELRDVSKRETILKQCLSPGSKENAENPLDDFWDVYKNTDLYTMDVGADVFDCWLSNNFIDLGVIEQCNKDNAYNFKDYVDFFQTLSNKNITSNTFLTCVINKTVENNAFYKDRNNLIDLYKKCYDDAQQSPKSSCKQLDYYALVNALWKPCSLFTTNQMDCFLDCLGARGYMTKKSLQTCRTKFPNGFDTTDQLTYKFCRYRIITTSYPTLASQFYCCTVDEDVAANPSSEPLDERRNAYQECASKCFDGPQVCTNDQAKEFRDVILNPYCETATPRKVDNTVDCYEPKYHFSKRALKERNYLDSEYKATTSMEDFNTFCAADSSYMDNYCLGVNVDSTQRVAELKFEDFKNRKTVYQECLTAGFDSNRLDLKQDEVDKFLALYEPLCSSDFQDPSKALKTLWCFRRIGFMDLRATEYCLKLQNKDFKTPLEYVCNKDSDFITFLNCAVNEAAEVQQIFKDQTKRLNFYQECSDAVSKEEVCRQSEATEIQALFADKCGAITVPRGTAFFNCIKSQNAEETWTSCLSGDEYQFKDDSDQFKYLCTSGLEFTLRYCCLIGSTNNFNERKANYQKCLGSAFPSPLKIEQEELDEIQQLYQDHCREFRSKLINRNYRRCLEFEGLLTYDSLTYCLTKFNVKEENWVLFGCAKSPAFQNVYECVINEDYVLKPEITKAEYRREAFKKCTAQTFRQQIVSTKEELDDFKTLYTSICDDKIKQTQVLQCWQLEAYISNDYIEYCLGLQGYKYNDFFDYLCAENSVPQLENVYNCIINEATLNNDQYRNANLRNKTFLKCMQDVEPDTQEVNFVLKTKMKCCSDKCAATTDKGKDFLRCLEYRAFMDKRSTEECLKELGKTYPTVIDVFCGDPSIVPDFYKCVSNKALEYNYRYRNPTNRYNLFFFCLP